MLHLQKNLKVTKTIDRMELSELVFVNGGCLDGCIIMANLIQVTSDTIEDN